MLRSFLKNDNVFIYSQKDIDDVKKRNLINYFTSLENYINEFNRYSSDIKIFIPKGYNEMNYIDRYINTNDYIRSLNINSDKLSNPSRNNYSYINSTLNSIRDLLEKSASSNYVQKQKINELDITYIPILRGVECFNIYYDIKQNSILDSVAMNEQQRQAMEEYKMNSKKYIKIKL